VIFLAGPLDIHLALWPPTSLSLMFSTIRLIIFSPQQDSVPVAVTSTNLTRAPNRFGSLVFRGQIKVVRVGLQWLPKKINNNN